MQHLIPVDRQAGSARLGRCTAGARQAAMPRAAPRTWSQRACACVLTPAAFPPGGMAPWRSTCGRWASMG